MNRLIKINHSSVDSWRSTGIGTRFIFYDLRIIDRSPGESYDMEYPKYADDTQIYATLKFTPDAILSRLSEFTSALQL